MKNIFALIIISSLSLSCISIKTTGQAGKPGLPGKSGDEILAEKEVRRKKLADSLGADERGMKNYMLVILKTGPNDAKITDMSKREELFKGHFSNMETMTKAGKLKVAGPFATKNNLQYRGLFILDVATEDEAKTLIKQDPTIKEGIFDVEILPWYGSAALPMYLPYHEKITK